MRRRDEDDGTSAHLACEQCEQTYERVFIQECSYCFKRFCRNCAVRSGSTAFCSKACAEGWFFADADEGAEE
jgi:hypothetical protein